MTYQNADIITITSDDLVGSAGYESGDTPQDSGSFETLSFTNSFSSSSISGELVDTISIS